MTHRLHDNVLATDGDSDDYESCKKRRTMNLMNRSMHEYEHINDLDLEW